MDIVIYLNAAHFPQLLRRYTARRLHLTLGQFGSRVGRLDVRVIGRSASSDGQARCQISAEVLPSGHVFAEDAASDLYLAVDFAAASATAAFRTELHRIRLGEAGDRANG